MKPKLWRVECVDRNNGKPGSVLVQAPSMDAAREQAASMGLVVGSAVPHDGEPIAHHSGGVRLMRAGRLLLGIGAAVALSVCGVAVWKAVEAGGRADRAEAALAAVRQESVLEVREPNERAIGTMTIRQFNPGEPFVLHGPNTARHENGQIESVVLYERGVMADQELIFYRENGKIAGRGWIKGGKNDGRHVRWYEDGTMESEGDYLAGEREGRWRQYHEDGKLWTDEVYRAGRVVK